MDYKTYELHNLKGKKLPIIFHYNIIKKSSPEITNWHENVEILCFTAGHGHVICNSVTYEAECGDIIIVNSNVLHGVKSDSQVEYHCLIVDSDFLFTNAFPAEEIDFDTFVRSPQAFTLFEQVAEEINSQKEYRIAGIRARILELMVYLARNHSANASLSQKNTTDENIKRAIGYIKSNFSQRLTLEKIASEVSLSKYYFAREFKKATGMTVVAYINAVRCHNANKMLINQKHSISEVAAACGFENNSYFSKTFKSVMGCLPSEIVKAS